MNQVGTQGTSIDMAEGYKMYIGYLTGEIERLRKLIGKLPEGQENTLDRS